MLRLTRSLAARPAWRISALPAAWRSIASPTARSCATAASQHLDSAGRGRRRRRVRRRAGHLSSFTQANRARSNGLGCNVGRLSRTGSSARTRSKAGCKASGARFTTLDEADMIDDDGAGARRRQSRRLVSGPHGIRPARARQPLDHCRSAHPGNAEESQSEGQISRELSSLRAVGSCATMLADWFDLDVDSPYMLLVADVAAQHKRAT